MIIINNTIGKLTITGMLISGDDIIISGSASVNIADSLLLEDSLNHIQEIFGSAVTLLPSTSNISTGLTIALADTAITLSASDLVAGVIYTAVPTVARSQTTPTATQIISAIPYARVGNTFRFSIVNTAAFSETLLAGANVTIIGNAVCTNASATFRALLTSLTTITLFRE